MKIEDVINSYNKVLLKCRLNNKEKYEIMPYGHFVLLREKQKCLGNYIKYIYNIYYVNREKNVPFVSSSNVVQTNQKHPELEALSIEAAESNLLSLLFETLMNTDHNKLIDGSYGME